MDNNNIKYKDSGAVLDFGFNWNDPEVGVWLAEDEVITEYTLTVPTGIKKESDNQANGIVTLVLSGGTIGTWYNIVCKIKTNQNRIDRRTMRIKVIER